MKISKAVVLVGTLLAADAVPHCGWGGVVFTNLYSFTGGDDGAFPWRLVKGRDGVIYGSADAGGPYQSQVTGGYGTIFRISPGCGVIAFGYLDGTNGDDAHEIVQSPDGSIYGISRDGGIGFTPPYGGGGTVFKVLAGGGITSVFRLMEPTGAVRPHFV